MSEKKPEAQGQEMQFPEHLKEVFIGAKFSCQQCENRFSVIEKKPNGSKSRSWTLGLMSWGSKNPSAVECFIIKCPSCGQPIQAVVISKRHEIKATNGAKPTAKPAPPPPPPQPPKARPAPPATPPKDEAEELDAKIKALQDKKARLTNGD